ncbi:hydrolase, alpha/beta domain protein [Aeromicrobium marinum DSM 15272]|uniref:Hydrolase, alpha/beta domain protein n=1 Tax=Aeromicrobium marinum DSM 15272 TaxID=585531 RepID=E2SCZ5_9ACTN|nr:alpha/beta hydrolase [Aeromicrobium marinum]EFQ83098.1 hydrolase, alpha/beta domain protein [Aeromicrobium marinum DSM 15272]
MTTSFLRLYDVTSADGTRLRAWTNDGDGPVVIVSNGLGTPPQAWPLLLQPGSGLRVVGWNHRGVGGSERPANGRIDMDAHIEDITAVMDDIGVESAVVVGWSFGVNVAFELAYRDPSRVQGILAVAGVPGSTFSTMLAPLKVPPRVAENLMVTLTRATTVTGHGIAPLSRRWPWTRFTADLVRMSRFISPAADSAELQTVLQEFFTTHPAWYARLALSASEHSRVSLSGITVPTTFLAGTRDLLAGSAAMRSAAERIPGARFREIRATHFIPVEHPELVLAELRALIERV